MSIDAPETDSAPREPEPLLVRPRSQRAAWSTRLLMGVAYGVGATVSAGMLGAVVGLVTADKSTDAWAGLSGLITGGSIGLGVGYLIALLIALGYSRTTSVTATAVAGGAIVAVPAGLWISSLPGL